MTAHAVKSKPKEPAKPDRAQRAPDEYGLVRTGFDGLFLQRKASCACGGGCPACSSGLKVSNPNDAAEIEADRVADRVMRMSSDRILPAQKITPAKTAIHRKCKTCEDELPIQRKSLPNGGAQIPSQSPGHVREALQSGGRPLDRETRGFFEPRFGFDLGGVRIHTGAAAERSAWDIDAKAYTLGHDIVFGRGQFAPGTDHGRRLLAHELAHVVQSATSPSQISRSTIYRDAAGAAKTEIKLEGLPPDGAYLKALPKSDADNFPGDMIKNGDTVKVRNEGGAATYNAVKSGKWSWIEVPGKKSTDKAYRVLHGFIESKYIVVKKTAPPPAPVADKKTDQPADGQPPEASNVPDTGKVHAKLKLLNQKRLGGTRVDAAIELARHAIIAATDTPPDSEVALMRLKQVEDFLRPLIEEKNVRKYFSGAVTGTQAGIIVAQSVSAVHSLQTYIRLGLNASEDGRNGGLWDYYFAQLKLGREHMVVLSGDLPMTISMWPLDQKLQASLKASTKYFEGEWGDRFNELISPTSLGIMAGMTGLWAISQATPVGWIADGIALFLISVTIFFVGKEAKEIAELLVQFFSLTLNAKSQSDFDLAGKAFAAAVTKASIDIIMAILFHKGGKALGPKIPGMVQALKMKGGKFTFGLEPIGEAAGGPGGVRMPIPEKGPATMMSESAPGTGAAPQPATGAGPGATPQPAAGGAPTPGINPAASAGATAAFANMLVLAKWLGKKMNVGDLPLPEGYNWKNKKISRNPGKKEANYAPLELRDGILQIGEGGERISNPSVMNRNYVASLTQAIKAKFPQLSELQAKAEAVAQAAKESIHHLIPDNVVQSHPLMKLAKELFGYDLDRGSNLKGLPKSKALTGAGETGHWTSHPKYDAIVWEKLETLKTKLDAEFKSFDKTPKQRLLDEIFKIESELRKLIEDGKAPMKDGHLAENEPVTPEGDGGSEYA